MMARRVLRCLAAAGLLALCAGGPAETAAPAASAEAAPQSDFRPSAPLPANAVSFRGRLEILGSEPHTAALIRLDDGRAFLVDPVQWREHPLKTGRYGFTGRLSPPVMARPGLGIPLHDQVVWLYNATETIR
jgi:hypothetical protein